MQCRRQVGPLLHISHRKPVGSQREAVERQREENQRDDSPHSRRRVLVLTSLRRPATGCVPRAFRIRGTGSSLLDLSPCPTPAVPLDLSTAPAQRPDATVHDLGGCLLFVRVHIFPALPPSFISQSLALFLEKAGHAFREPMEEL